MFSSQKSFTAIFKTQFYCLKSQPTFTAGLQSMHQYSPTESQSLIYWSVKKKKKILLNIFSFPNFFPTSSLEHDPAPTLHPVKSLNVAYICYVFFTSPFTSIEKHHFYSHLWIHICICISYELSSPRILANSVCRLFLECQGTTITSFEQCITVNHCTGECKQNTT